MISDRNMVPMEQNRIEFDDGTLFCRWHTENGEPMLEGKNGTIAINKVMQQILNPKPEKSGRQGRRGKPPR